MKKYLFLFCMFLLGSHGINAQDKQGPDLKFEEELFDFGTFEEGIQATHEFKFENTGNQALIITDVRASCGCTAPSWPQEPILPGKTAVITAVYNSKGRVGVFSKSITVTSNAVTPTKILTIKGKVEPTATGPVLEEKKPNNAAE